MISLRYFAFTVLLYLIFLQCAEATRIWNFLGKRAPSPDNTCGKVGAGNNNGYTCNPALPAGGNCCSANGYCGDARDYCGPGCQSGFGTCDSSLANTDPYVCGPQNKGLTCADNQCCSPEGYCGNSADYCGSGCQSKYGRCGSAGGSSGGTGGASGSGSATVSGSGDSSLKATPTATSVQPSKTAKLGGSCGPTNGGAKCSSTECCSAAGWCGTGKDYCADPDCQFQYGICDSNKTPPGASTANDPRPPLGKVTYSDDIYDCVKSNVVALTFDDGPYLYTSGLLDILKTFGFHATFFMTGNNMGKGMIDTTDPYPALVKRMIADGHQVASHTWSHYSLDTLTTKMRIDQMTKNERAIANIIGKYPTYMRPPYSQCSKETGCWADLQKLGYHRTYFDLDTQDYLNPLASQIQKSKDIVNNFLNGAKSKGATDYLSIQHDVVSQSATNLSTYYYTQIKNKGWKGVTVGECLNDPETNWYRTPGGGSSSSSSATNSSSGTIKTTAGLSSSQSTSPKAATANSTFASSDSSHMSSTSTSCSLETGLTSAGPVIGVSHILSNSMLANSSAASSGSSGSSGSYPTASAPSDSHAVIITGSSGYATDSHVVTITGSSGSSSGKSSAGAGTTSSGPAIPTTAGHGYAYVGCFADNVDHRAVAGAGYSPGMTVELCAEYCHNKSAPVFALEYQNECFCGLTLNDTKPRSTGCNLTCWGNPNEICGGDWAAQVYSLNQSSTATAYTTAGSTATHAATDNIASEVRPSITSSLATAPSGTGSSTPSLTSANASTAGESAGTGFGGTGAALSSSLSRGSASTSASTSTTASTNTSTTASTNSSSVTSTSNTSSVPANNTAASSATTNLKSSTTASTSPTSTCLVTTNRFCGTVKPFNDNDACWDAVADCTDQIVDCYHGANATDTDSLCSKYTDQCISLFWFCRNCTSTCSSTDFKSQLSLNSSSSSSSGSGGGSSSSSTSKSTST